MFTDQEWNAVCGSLNGLLGDDDVSQPVPFLTDVWDDPSED